MKVTPCIWLCLEDSSSTLTEIDESNIPDLDDENKSTIDVSKFNNSNKNSNKGG